MKHEDQQKIWDREHSKPTVLLQMDSDDASSGVKKFWEWLDAYDVLRETGIEMGCGKGRNVIWLAKQGIAMSGFDFSPAAIEEAKRRATDVPNASFQVADATQRWPYDDASFDFGIDCFASTDIESPEGRQAAIAELRRVLKPGGLLLAYLLSTDDEFHKEMVQSSPAHERNVFLHPTGKFEKIYDEQDIAELFGDWEVAAKERIPKTATFGDKEYACNHFWLVLRK